ncbi:MAG: tetratricopeptide repeat protein [Alphaproteobacteria bacterium]|nr:tetratricopeptide repeat protein [Alphaproteobacteria bacterium]
MADPAFAPVARLYQSGQHALAEAECRRLLAANPRHPDASHLLGVLLLQSNRTPEALTCLDSAVTARPGNLDAQQVFGTALAMSGDFTRALTCFEKVARAQPANLQALYNLGLTLSKLGRHEDARKHFAKLLSKDSRNVGAWMGQGAALAALGRFADAADSFAKADALAPNQPEIIENLALAYLDGSEPTKAQAALDRMAEDARQSRPMALILKARLFHLEENFSDSLWLLLSALKTAPPLSYLHALVLQNALLRGEAWDVALERLDELYAHRPDSSDICLFRGYALYLLERHGEAVPLLKNAMALGSDLRLAIPFLATALSELGRFEEALSLAPLAAERFPDHWDLTWDFAVKFLIAGRMQEGWSLFSRRMQSPTFEPTRFFPSETIFSGPLQALSGKTVLLWKEQGIGDELCFLSALPDLIKIAGKVILLCTPKLLPLLASSFPQVDVRPMTPDVAASSLGEVEAHLPVGDLFVHFRKSLDAFPPSRSYLRASPGLKANWKDFLDGLGPGKKVGISWTSTHINRQRLRHHFRDLSQWGPILKSPDICFINLQPKADPEQLLAAEQAFGCTIHQPVNLDLFDDLENVAGLMSQLDLVISVGSLVSFLSGALGIPTWVFYIRNVHWDCMGSDHFPWIPACRLLERKLGEDWSGAVAEAAGRLASGKNN